MIDATSPPPARRERDPLPPAARLLAQASAAATHRALRTRATTLTLGGAPLRDACGAPVRVGPGLDGSVSATTGFLPAYRAPRRLPPAFAAYERLCARLPELVRTHRARAAIVALPALHEDAFVALPERFLARAALLLSTLAHAFYFDHRERGVPDAVPLPAGLLTGWRKICARLQRPVAGARVPADDMLNNVIARTGRARAAVPLRLRVNYFGLAEEQLSSGLQGSAEARFAGCLVAMCAAQAALAAGDEPALVAQLEAIAAHLVGCGELIEAMAPPAFDAVIWGRTYPEMGRPIAGETLGNSGADAPMFHALDAFLGRRRARAGCLEQQQARRRAALPAPHQALITALADPRYSVRDRVAKADVPRARHAFEVVLQIYAWLLERHRRKAVGAIPIVLGAGRPSTAGGAVATSAASHAAVAGAAAPGSAPPVDVRLDQQMRAAAADRFGAVVPPLSAEVVATRQLASAALGLTLRFVTCVPARAGDHVYLWPEPSGPLAPRAYSVADVGAVAPGIAQTIDLTIGLPAGAVGLASGPLLTAADAAVTDPHAIGTHGGGVRTAAQVGDTPASAGEGPAVAYLRRLRVGARVSVKLSPTPRFRLPADVRLPLVLIGQGSGVGPLYGFLAERARLPDMAQDEIGPIALFVAARRAADIPYLDALLHLTERLPLTLSLALTGERARAITAGMVTHLPAPMRVAEALARGSGPLRQAMGRGGHLYVCGGVAFGHDVGAQIARLLRPRQPASPTAPSPASPTAPTSASPTAPSPTLPTASPTAPSSALPTASPTAPSSASPTVPATALPPWRARYHEALFSQPDLAPPPRALAPQALAAHNRPDDCWLALGGRVYDLTHYAATHPGGAKVLWDVAGGVADRRFDQIHGGLHAREIRARMAPYAIGTLAPWPDGPAGGPWARVRDLLGALVAAQNTLRNNTTFLGDRQVPYYVVADALLVLADVGLPAIFAQLAAPSDLAAQRARLVAACQGFRAAARAHLQAAGLAAEAAICATHRDLVTLALAALEAPKRLATAGLDAAAAAPPCPGAALALGGQVGATLGRGLADLTDHTAAATAAIAGASAVPSGHPAAQSVRVSQ